MSTYWGKNYDVLVIEGVDKLNVSKTNGSDWADIKMTISDETTIITLRSETMANMLYIMLGQILGKDND